MATHHDNSRVAMAQGLATPNNVPAFVISYPDVFTCANDASGSAGETVSHIWPERSKHFMVQCGKAIHLVL